MRRTLQTLGAAVALVLALTACGGLPTSGPVNAGRQVSEDESGGEVVFLPDGPAPDATPQQIVEGFIAAGSGPRGNWETAKEFLAPEFTTWDPRAGVTIYSPGDRSLEEVSASEFVLSVAPVATVDAVGELSTPGEPGEILLGFSLAQQSDGQWRITKAPDGIVLDRNRFGVVYGAYSLQFFDPTWTYLVPDERWFPRLYARTNIAEALVDGGPSPWLAASVATAFTDGARLAVATVPLSADVAQVTLEEGARGLDRAVLDRMQTQLEGSLEAANVDAVDMLVDGQLLAAEAVPVRTTRVDARPLVRTQDAFGFASGTTIEEIAGLSEAVVQVDATDIEVDASRSVAAVREATGAVVRVSGDGGIVEVDDRTGLVAPSIDPLGYIWSVPSGAPSAVLATGPSGAAIDIPAAWTGAAQVLAQRVSRDGTRLAAVVRAGDGYALWVAGIVRDRDGVPTGLGERKVLAVLPGASGALTWLDAATLALVTSDGEDLYLFTQEVGGFGSLVPAPDAVTTVAGGVVQSGGIRLRDSAGELFGQRGANWQHLGSGILVLAVQQGSPR